MKKPDDNDRHKDGSLPPDPFADTRPEPDSVDSVYGGGGGEPQDWPDPILYDVPAASPFPQEALYVPALRNFVLAEAEAVQVPIDFPGLLVLGNLSAAIAPKVEVVVRPDHVEQLNLYIALVAATGERKSPPFEHAARPLREWEKAEIERLAPEVRRVRQKIEILEKALEHAQRKAATSAKAGARQAHLESAHDLREQLAAARAEMPPDATVFCDNVTPEKFAGLLAVHGGAMAAFSDEGSFLSNCFRYSSLKDDAKIENVLKAYGGEEIRVDRGSREGEFVRRPCLTLVACVQPDFLRHLPQKDLLRGRGVFSRCLFGVPKSLVGSRKPDPDTVSEDVSLAYGSVVKALASKACGRDARGQYERHRAALSNDARHVRIAFAEELERRMRPEGDLHLVQDWANKAVGRAIRIGSLLHFAEYAEHDAPWAVLVSGRAVDAGVRVVRYGLEHFIVAMGLVSGRDSDKYALVVLDWIRTHGEDEFLSPKLYQSKRRSFDDDPENMEKALEELERRHCIRSLDRERAGSVGRRPRERTRWAINPKVRTRNTRNDPGGPEMRSGQP